MSTILVRNKKTRREEAWTDEDLANAKKSGLIERFEIVKVVKEPKKTAPLKEVLKFIQETEDIKADETAEPIKKHKHKKHD